VVKRRAPSRRIERATPESETQRTAGAAGVLHVVATPIGNLQDLSERARLVLAGADLVAAEDTRHTRQLLEAHGIRARLLSAHEHNESERATEILQALATGANVALVSDAGTPLVSDPGLRIVQAAIGAGFDVRAVPGPCAAIAALSIAGLQTDRFAFEGFLPTKRAARCARLAELSGDTHTLIFYEAPHRLAESLEDISATLGSTRRAVIARELTKVFESTYRGNLEALAKRAREESDLQRGEMVIIVEGATPANDAEESEIRRVLGVLLAQLSVSQAADLAATLTGASRNAAYRVALQLSSNTK
jgi:16S rRNA (cytidine1402-2'-O)-methyltransferase